MTEAPYSQLISKILEDAKQQAQGIVDDAKNSSERLLEQKRRETEEKAKRACQEMLRSTEDEVENTIHRESVDAIIKTRWILLSEKRKIIDDVIKKAEQRLQAFTKHEAYPQILERLIEEAALAAGGGKLEILLNKADSQTKLRTKEIAKRVSSKLGVETVLGISQKTIDALGGVIVQSADGRTKIDNTLGSILERARRKLEPAITAMLFAEKTG